MDLLFLTKHLLQIFYGCCYHNHTNVLLWDYNAQKHFNTPSSSQTNDIRSPADSLDYWIRSNILF